ncbi:hypothetical protein V8E36_001192 [Tilletia maclaganii]
MTEQAIDIIDIAQHVIPRRRRRKLRASETSEPEAHIGDSNEIFGAVFSHEASRMTHNHIAGSTSFRRTQPEREAFETQRATVEKLRAGARARHIYNDIFNSFAPGDYGGDNFDGGSSSAYTNELSTHQEDSDSSDFDSDAGGEDHFQRPVQGPGVSQRDPSNSSLSYRDRQETVKRFYAWHHTVPTLFGAAYAECDTPHPRHPVVQCECPRDSPRRFELSLYVYRIGRPYPLFGWTCKPHLMACLIANGLFPATPTAPRVAFELPLLQLFQSLIAQLGMPARNMAATARVLMSLEPFFRPSYIPLKGGDTLRKQLRSAVTWLSVVENYDYQMALKGRQIWTAARPLLDEDDLKLTLEDLTDSCPACFHSFGHHASERSASASAEVPSTPLGAGTIFNQYGNMGPPQVIVAIDGNFTQKRRRRKDHVSSQPFPPRRFLSPRQVRAAERAWQAAGGSDPDNQSCVARPYEVTGLMGLCCRHDIPLVLCDITTPGERHHYATALLDAVISAIPGLTHIGVAYDIGCRFDPSTRVQNLFQDRVKISWAVSVFHVYGHTYSCQLLYNPRNLPGFGLTDGEGMERVWSELSNLIKTTRSMSRGERRHLLENGCQQLALSRRLGLFRLLKSKRDRVATNTARELSLLTGNYTASSVPAEFVGAVEDGDPSNAPARKPTIFANVDDEVYATVKRMADERRRLVRECVLGLVSSTHPSGQTENPPAPDDNDSGVVSPESSDDVESSDEDGTDADGVKLHLRAVGRLAHRLLRYIAEIELLKALRYDRPASVARGYKETARLSLSLRIETASAKKTMSRLNTAVQLQFEHQRTEVTAQRPDILTWSSLFSDEMSVQLEGWARAADPTATLPWWARPTTASTVNAFEILSRAAEETVRLDHEEAAAAAWVADEVQRLQARRSEHSSFHHSFRQAEALRDHWLGKADNAQILLPPGMCDDEQENEAIDTGAAADPELTNQLRRLGLDDPDIT